MAVRETGASREAYGAALAALDGFAGQAPAGELSEIGEQLLAVAGLLSREPRLRRALSDPARSAEDRAGLLGELFGGKIADRSLELLRTLVKGRFATPGVLLDVTEQLGVQALLASADRDGELAEVEDELFRFGQVVDGSPGLASALGDPAAPVDQRASLVADLLNGKARPVTVRLAGVALAGFGGRGFTPSLSRLVELAAARRDRGVAYITSAVPLTAGEETRLGDRLADMYGRRVSLLVTVDPKVIGGLSVQIGSDLYDGTLARRLAQARAALTT
jgi:F-type H+-transporting ATPase subunit delta